jgi:hypothetical protein
LTGTIEPARWDEQGPVRFDYTLEFKLSCPGRTSTLQTWHGTGRRD